MSNQSQSFDVSFIDESHASEPEHGTSLKIVTQHMADLCNSLQLFARFINNNNIYNKQYKLS
jgi:hypothetical protein